MPNTNQLFADHLKTFRRKRGQSQEALAYDLKIPRETLSKYETAKRNPTLKTLITWGIRLNIQPHELIPKVVVEDRCV